MVSFEDDEVIGGAWRLRRLLALTGSFRVMVNQSTVLIVREDRRQMFRNLGRRGFWVEDLNSGLYGNVVMAYEVVLELEERGWVQWSVVEEVARIPEVLLEIRTLVCLL